MTFSQRAAEQRVIFFYERWNHRFRKQAFSIQINILQRSYGYVQSKMQGKMALSVHINNWNVLLKQGFISLTLKGTSGQKHPTLSHRFLTNCTSSPNSSHISKITFYKTGVKCSIQQMQTPLERALSTECSCTMLAHTAPVAVLPWMRALRLSIQLSPPQQACTSIWLHLGNISVSHSHLIPYSLMQTQVTYLHII